MGVMIGSIIVILFVLIVSSGSESKNEPPQKPMSDTERAARFAARQTAAHLIRQLLK